MQYEIKYKYEGVIGTYYMPLIAGQELLTEDVLYSAKMAVAKFLGTSQFEIISIRECL
jgi:hypothetical protein